MASSDPHTISSVTRPDLDLAPLLFHPDAHSLVLSSSSSQSDPFASSPAPSALSPSTSASSLASSATSFVPSPSPASTSTSTPSTRRLSARPSPLVLKTNPPRATFSPRTSSLSNNSRISTVTTTARNSSGSTITAASDDRQSLRISTTSSAYSFQPTHPPPTHPPPPIIRRKPLAPGNRSRSSSRSTTATTASSISNQTITLSSIDAAASAATREIPAPAPAPPPSTSTTAFDVLYEDVLAASGDGSLATPDQRFTRPGSVDSPTLYEFPGGSEAKQTSIQTVLESVERPSTAVAPSSNSADHTSARAPTPVSSQTPTITAVSQHAHDLTPSPTLDLDLYDAYDTEPEAEEHAEHEQHEEPQEPPQEPQDLSAAASTPSSGRSSAMSQFSRKTSPPHLQLGSLSNTASNKDVHANKENKEPDDDQDSLYSIYNNNTDTDKEPKTASGQGAFVLPVINTSSATSATTILTDGSSPSSLLKPQPKSPGGSFKLGSLFGWSSASPASTDFSDRGSPLPSPSASLQPPASPAAHASSSQERASPTRSDSQTTKTQQTTPSRDQDDLYNNNNNSPNTTARALPSPVAPLSPSAASAKAHIEDMEDELQAISAELAASIRREMDLEDLVDRLQTEVGNGPQPNRRTSDYFSDSGYNSASGKAAGGDQDASTAAARDEIAQIQRWAEQEKARVRLELTEKLTDERMRRRELDQQIQALSARAAELEQQQEEHARRGSTDSSGAETSERVRQLESTCEDLRRRLSEERSVKENFEDLLAAMKTELQSAANERDNLRDEVVPQLRARVEGLESQAAEHARHVYETTKAAQQQELQINKGLPPPPPEQLQQPQQQQPPSSAPTTTGESREALAERLKDVEAQRDALHQALRSLLERQEFQNRENDKRIRGLEQERLRLLAASPKKAGYERDVAMLRDEVAILRRRAEEALEHKWQVEKGLASLKMDLDRAEAEIAHLHMLLRQNDILVPEVGAAPPARTLSDVSDASTTSASVSASTAATSLVTSSSLIGAYRDLQAAYADAVARIRQLEASTASAAATDAALQRLEKALASTIAERDAAVDPETAAAAAAAAAATAAVPAGADGGDKERSLAEQLEAAATQIEALAAQVRVQLAANAQLRDRLAGLAARSGADQQTYKQRITGLEKRLRTLEDELVAVQGKADERVAQQEEEVAALREANNTQLLRLRDATGQLRVGIEGNSSSSSIGSPGTAAAAAAAGLKSPLSPMFSINGRLVPPATPSRSSRPSSRGSATSGASASVEQQQQQQQQQQQIQDQAAQMAKLRARVGELEAALATAELEMQEVVGRMNTAQIEAMQLREEREEAARATRKLQRQLETEQVKTFEERFRTLAQA